MLFCAFETSPFFMFLNIVILFLYRNNESYKMKVVKIKVFLSWQVYQLHKIFHFLLIYLITRTFVLCLEVVKFLYFLKLFSNITNLFTLTPTDQNPGRDKIL